MRSSYSFEARLPLYRDWAEAIGNNYNLQGWPEQFSINYDFQASP